MILTRQPQTRPAIDGANPLTRGLVFCCIPLNGSFYDLISNQRTTHPGTSRARPTVDGNKAAATSAIGANAAGGVFTNPTGLDAISGPFSMFIEGSLEVNTSTQNMVGSRESSLGNGVTIRFDDAAIVSNGIIYYANNNDRTTSGFGALGTNSEQFTHRALVTVDGTNSRFYTKRALYATAATTTLPTANAARRTTMCGQSGTQQQGSVAIAMAWNRVLSLTEYQMLHDNPWQIFLAPQHARKMFSVGGGGGDVSVALIGQAATTASGTLAPSIAKALVGEVGTAAAGTLVATPTFGLSGQELTAAAGDVTQARTVALAGQAATIEQGSLGVVGDVTVALTGQSMTMGQGSLSIPSVAAESYSGGFFEVPHVGRRRTVREERERLGIFPREVKQIVQAVARASVVADKTDYQAEQQLSQRLAQQDIEAKARYAEFLKQERDRLLSRDIERALRIRQRQYEIDEDEREAEMLLM